MNLDLHFVTERPVPDVALWVEVADLLDCDALDAVAARLEVRPLLSFLSEDPDEAAEFARANDLGVPSGGFPPEEWFDPADALATVHALLAEVEDNPEAVLEAYKAVDPPRDPLGAPDPDDVLDGLEQLDEVLTDLVAAKVRFHFGVGSGDDVGS